MTRARPVSECVFFFEVGNYTCTYNKRLEILILKKRRDTVADTSIEHSGGVQGGTFQKLCVRPAAAIGTR